MASYAQSSLHVEIQYLKDALAASEKKAGRYAQMVATLTVELDDLRRGICDFCKKKLLSSNSSVPPTTISAGQGSITVSLPLWRRVFEGRQRSRTTTDNLFSIGLSRSLAASPNTHKPLLFLSKPEVAHNLNFSPMTPTPTHPGPNGDMVSSGKKPKPPQWSVEYHTEVERALDLRLAHAFTYDFRVYCVKMSHDGQRLAVGLGGDGKTYLYEMKTGSNIGIFVDRYVNDPSSIWSVQFSPDGQFLATGAFDGNVRIWDIDIKRMRAMFKEHKYSVESVAFSPNGRSVVSASVDRSVRIWNIRDGSSKVLPVIGEPDIFFCVAFSPDGRYVAAGNYDDSLWIWDSRTHRLVAKWWGHTHGVWGTEFTPDGKGLMSGGFDKTIKHWDVSLLGSRQGVTTGRVINEELGFPELRRFLGHDGGIYSIALFPDNARWIVTGSSDRSVRVWDTESGVCQLTLQGHIGLVRGVDVSRTQNFLATTDDDGYVTVWKYKLL